MASPISKILKAFSKNFGTFASGMTAWMMMNLHGDDDVEGKVDAIVMTGGVSNDVDFIANVKKYAGWIGEFIVLAGDFEMEALASGAIRALNKEEELLEYTGVPVWTHFDFEPADE